MEEQFRVIMDALAEIDRLAKEDRAALESRLEDATLELEVYREIVPKVRAAISKLRDDLGKGHKALYLVLGCILSDIPILVAAGDPVAPKLKLVKP